MTVIMDHHSSSALFSYGRLERAAVGAAEAARRTIAAAGLRATVDNDGTDDCGNHHKRDRCLAPRGLHASDLTWWACNAFRILA
jgi:hypothetical protein